MKQQTKVEQEGGADTWSMEKIGQSRIGKVKVWWHRVPYINFFTLKQNHQVDIKYFYICLGLQL